MAAFPLFKRMLTDAARPGAKRRSPRLRRNSSTFDKASQLGLDATTWRALRVLIAGDAHDATDNLVRLVLRSGHAAYTAHDGLAALRVAADQEPDVVLLNLDIRVISARQVAPQMRLDSPRNDCFIIGLAGGVDGARRRQNSAAGIDLVLAKPLAPAVVEILLLLECLRVHQRRESAILGDSPNRPQARGSSC